MTRQRALILGIMREKCPEHLTADEIFSHARQAMRTLRAALCTAT